MSSVFSNNLNSLNTTSININVADDRSNILAWISPLDPRLRHQDIRDRRVENVGEWLLRTDEFRSWYAGSGGDASDEAVLFCYGDPGVGKTFISSLVVDSLCDRTGGQNATVACFYFDFAAKKEHTLTNMLGSVLKQLACGLEETPEEISRACQAQKSNVGGRGLQFPEIVKMMQTASPKKRTFICIDALDECAAGYRVKLLDSLNKILENSPGTRVFMTGRPHIRPEIGRCLAGRTTSLRISPKRDDIITYLHTRMHEDTTPEAMDSSLEADILKKIPDDVSEIFLLVSLNIDAILQETTIHRRRQKLGAMTDGLGLGDAYGATINRIKAQAGEKARLGVATLMWISHSERPLKTDELCHALAVEIGSDNLNPDNVPSIGTLLTCCQGLIAVDRETSTVRLIHFTLQEYLRAHPELFGGTHSTIAETCLSYLNSQQVKALSTILSPDLLDTVYTTIAEMISPILTPGLGTTAHTILAEAFLSFQKPEEVEALSATPSLDLAGTPFLEYSSLYWGMHAKRELSGCAKFLALKLFDDYNGHISTRILSEAQGPYSRFHAFHNSSRFTGLHCASLFGIVELVAALIDVEGCDINQKDCLDNTPLMWAVRHGHEAVVKILLGRDDVNPEEPDKHGQTPLCCAASRGHEGVLKILLGRDDVNPNKPDNDGITPLGSATWNGREGVVRILLAQDDVNPNIRDKHGETPLGRAVWNGHEGVIKILLARDDVNPNIQDIDGRTPLSRAVELLYGGVVKILLERDDVNPNKQDENGETALHAATSIGYEGAVRMLLRRDDINPNQPDNSGQTPLLLAFRRRYEGIVSLLLPRSGLV